MRLRNGSDSLARTECLSGIPQGTFVLECLDPEKK